MGGSTRRVSLAYVELAPSRTSHKHLPHVSSAGHKENALSRSSVSQMNPSTPPASAQNKRKLDVDAGQPAAKKPKQPMDPLPQPPNATDEFPNGFVYCHQCNKKRDVTASVRCTAKDRKGRRCNAKYCKACLRNRYGLVLEDILADSETDEDNDVHGLEYHFRCPRCDDVCNCVACRKAKGLQPTGNLANAARQSGLTSAADVLRQDPKAAGPMAHKPGEKMTMAHGIASKHEGNSKSSAPVKRGAKQVAGSSKPVAKPKALPKPKVKAPSKPLAKPVWTCVGTVLSEAEAEERINIREFALRFSSVLDLPRSHLDELDEIRPTRTRNFEDEDDDLVSWVSEPCAKSLILGLLDILGAKGDREKHIKATTKSIRESGAHLNKIWAALATLRDRQENTPHRASTGFPLLFPDPLPPPESLSIIRTRSGANQSNTGSINVLRTAQLIPVISALINAAVESEVVRQELEAGIQESKERIKEARDAHRIENERFEREKEREKATGKRLDKSKTECHKRIVATIDDALKVTSYAYIPRFSSLGRDMEGRTYWALTPGINEREDALVLLQSYSQGRTHRPSKSRRKPVVPSEEDRCALRKWPWFVAVWGKRPPIAECTVIVDPDDSDEEEADENENEEQWWGFWDPEEIVKLASWVHFKTNLEETSEQMSSRSNGVSSRKQSLDSDVDMEDPTDDESNADEPDDNTESSMIPTKDEVATLTSELEQYALLLRGRIKKVEELEDAHPAKR